MLAAAGLLAGCTMQASGTPEDEVATFDAQDTEVAATDRIQFVTNLDGDQETPPVETIANGSGMATWDRATKKYCRKSPTTICRRRSPPPISTVR